MLYFFWMTIADKIKSFVEEFINEDLFVVDVLLKGKKIGQKLIVLIDGDDGVPIDRCVAVSRFLSARLDELNIMEGSYQLEVSSPGLDHPIKLKRQFIKNQGRTIKVATESKEVTGKLIKVSDSLTLEVQEKKDMNKIEIPFNQIIKANVLVSFK